MSAKQDKFVPTRELSWSRDGGRARIAADGTDLSLHERLEYAISLIPPDRWNAIERSPKQIRRYISGADVPLSVLTMISAASGLPIDWLVAGRPSPEWEATRADFRQSVAVEKLLFVVLEGEGARVFEEASEAVFLPREVLERLELSPDDARLFTAIGDSMLPTIEDGDPLLVDMSATDVIEGKIYVFTIGDQILVKRLRRLGDKLLMRSDNRELYPDEDQVPSTGPVRIIGRVRWVGRTL